MINSTSLMIDACYLNIPNVVIAGVSTRSSYVAAVRERERKRDGTSVQSAGRRGAAAAAAAVAVAAC